MKTITVGTDQVFEQQECINCGCVFYIPHTMGNTLRSNKQSFYCPSGHSQAYITSESEKLRQQIETIKQQLAYSNNRITELTAPKPKRRAMRKAI